VWCKQNTGGGKTAAGLLIAQSTMNEGVGKAVYLAPDTYIASRVREEAAVLSLVTASEPTDVAWRAQKAILVTTFQKLINGMSVFGVAEDGREPIDLGVVVVDDAHTALARTEGQFRLSVLMSHREGEHVVWGVLADRGNDGYSAITIDLVDEDGVQRAHPH
jgi:replicative superfamily II helicase